jgi:hypothetical protein
VTEGREAGLQPKLPPVGSEVKTGGVVSTVQVYTTVCGAEVLPQASVAVTVNVLVWAQGEPLRADVTVMVGVLLQLSVAVTKAFTLATEGSVAGLQPRLLPVGTVTTGAVVSTVQV